ncbi:hypothetical protein [Desulfospira joergensenii]|uniref:hypothetical protein n=1 Tax=Desulfospira joergensenii TaxID=53329 RepID=UPI0003B521A4|nr:hypothetical protein [Desulfospira joergensenii]
MNLLGPEETAANFFPLLEKELRAALTLFWEIAQSILDKSPVQLNPPSSDYFSLENNFFSALFLYSYIRSGISEPRRILFAAMNQCLRGMVTGCDNLLDDEYKQTLDTDLPGNARKFRSILDIMTSDRILTAIMYRGCQEGEFSQDQILSANRASLHALLKSGAQEASEEKGIDRILGPETLLSEVHSIKTGILFQAPWVLPQLIGGKGSIPPDRIKEGLFFLGMGCQVLDDMVDMAMDIVKKRHNYVISLIVHGKDLEEKKRLEPFLYPVDPKPADSGLLDEFPRGRKKAAEKALHLLEKGSRMLFAPEHEFMVPYSIEFFARRIGADRFLDPVP